MAQGDVGALRIDGLAGSDERWTTAPNRALKIQDAFYDRRGGWERCGGTEKILRDSQGTSPFAGWGKIQSMHWFSRHNGGPQYLVFELGPADADGLTRLCYFNGSTNNWTVIKDAAGNDITNRYTTDQPWQRTQYAAVGNNLWIINGENEPIRFDGRIGHKAGFDGPAPSVTVQGYTDGFLWGTTYAGLGLGTPATADRVMIAGVQNNAGTAGYADYAWVITEENLFGTRSPPSPIYGAVKWRVDQSNVDDGTGVNAGTQGTKFFADIRIPPPSGTHVFRRALWRTQNTTGVDPGMARTYYLVDDDLAGQGSFPYVDGKPDNALGFQLQPEKIGPFPRGAKYMCFFKQRAYYAGMPDNPDRLYYSEPGDPENVPAQNWFSLGNSDNGEITGLREARNGLVTFKRRGVFMIMSDDGVTLTPKTIDKSRGCAAPNSIREVPGVGLVFASDEGVFRLTGSIQQGDDPAAIQPLTDTLADFWTWQVNRTAMMNAWGEVYHRDDEYWLSVPLAGNPRNQMVCVYHYLTGVWSFRPDINAACLAETHDHRGYLYIGSNDDTSHPGIHVYSRAYSTKDGVAIAFQIQTSWLDLGGVYEHFIPEQVIIRALAYGTASMTVTVYRDRSATAVTVGGQTRKMEDAETILAPPPVWGTATWSLSATERWGRASPTVFPVAIGAPDAGATSKEFMVQIDCTSRVQILGLTLRVAPGPATPILDAVTATGSET